jgi:hypothetical protein
VHRIQAGGGSLATCAVADLSQAIAVPSHSGYPVAPAAAEARFPKIVATSMVTKGYEEVPLEKRGSGCNITTRHGIYGDCHFEELIGEG